MSSQEGRRRPSCNVAITVMSANLFTPNLYVHWGSALCAMIFSTFAPKIFARSAASSPTYTLLNSPVYSPNVYARSPAVSVGAACTDIIENMVLRQVGCKPVVSEGNGAGITHTGLPTDLCRVRGAVNEQKFDPI